MSVYFWQLMRGGRRNVTTDAPSLVSSLPPSYRYGSVHPPEPSKALAKENISILPTRKTRTYDSILQEQTQHIAYKRFGFYRRVEGGGNTMLALTISFLKRKYDAKPTYKKFLALGLALYVIGDKIVYIENSVLSNTNVRFHQANTHKRFFALLESQNIRVNRFQGRLQFLLEEIVSEIRSITNISTSVPTMQFALQ